MVWYDQNTEEHPYSFRAGVEFVDAGSEDRASAGLVVPAVADSYIDAAAPETNISRTAKIRIDGSPLVVLGL